jgi:hypothetical protein
MKSAHSKMYSLIWWTHKFDSDSNILGIGDEDESMHFANSCNADDSYGYNIAAKAVEFDQTDALLQLTKYGCPMDRTAPIMAVRKNNLEMLQLLYTINDDENAEFKKVQNIDCWGKHVSGLLKNQFSWIDIFDGWLFANAAEELDEGSTEKIIKWFKERNLHVKTTKGSRNKRNDLRVKDAQPIDPPYVREDLKIDYLTVDTFFEKGLMHNDEEQIFYGWINAARCGSVDVMDWAYQQGYSTIWGATWGGGHTYDCEDISRCELICAKAAEYGQLEHLKKLRSLECPWSADTTTMASKNGHIATLQWAFDNGCKLVDESYNVAAKYGHDHIVRWLKERNIAFPMEKEWSRETRWRLIQKCIARGTTPFEDYTPKHFNDSGYRTNPCTNFNSEDTDDKLTRMYMACVECKRLHKPVPTVWRLPAEVFIRALQPNYLSDNEDFVKTYDLEDLLHAGE